MISCDRQELVIVGHVTAGDGEMKSSVRGDSLVAGGQDVERGPQPPSPFTVDQSGATKVPVEVSLLDEGGKGRLGDTRWAPVSGLADGTDRRDERSRGN
jgi:hypothetical protein